VGDAAAYAAALAALLRSREVLLAQRRASWRKAAEFGLPGIVGAYEGVLGRAGEKTAE
jgi:hypothetical protein